MNPFFGELWMSRKKSKPRKRAGSRSALRKESDRALVEQIRRQLALPPEKRTNFLRVRRAGGGSSL